MQLTTENTKEFIEFWNNNKPEKFVHPMHEGIATVILDYLDQAEYQLTLEDNKVTIFDQQTNEELGEYTPEELFWKARLLIESNDKDSRSSTNHYNNLLDIFSNKELSPKEYKEQIRDELQNYYFTKECFNKNDELKWNSINYTTKNWIEIENTYYEYEETRGFLSIGDSLTDLEEEYGENNFPEKAVEDGKLKIFDVYANDVEDYLREKYNLKDSEEINEILGDYEYKTEDLLKYYIPNLSNENAELLSVIIDTQYIYLDHLPSITFENIYNKIDKSKLNEVQLEELNKIKEELSKPTVEIFKQSFDSFIMSLSEAASKSIQRDIEKLNAKAFYVFNVDNNEYTIVSKRDGENPFMVHKYYPENETGGIHHGSYDINTYENAEKIAANRLINEQKEKYELINFIAGTRENEFNLELKNELSSVFEYLNEYSLTEENNIKLIDVKAYQYEGPSGKLKVLVEYKGNCREDDLFNLLHDDEENGQDRHEYEINGYKLDLNPIKAEKSGTISEYLTMLKNVEEKWTEVNKQEWQKSIEAWNKNKQGTNSEFKSIGTLIEVNSSDEQQIESLRKNTKDFNIDQKEAKALLSMVNYDSSSFEFMFDIDNGNFVEIDKKNKKIIDVATSKNILGYLTDEIKYIIKEEVSESFTVEELFNANVLNNVLEYINKEPRYFQDLNKVEKEAVISGYWEAPDPDMYEKVVEEFYYKKGLKEPEPGLVQYPGDEWVSNYLSDNKINFNTEYWNSIFEVVNRQENAFEVAKKYFTEIDSSKEYDEFQKLDFVKKFFNLLKQGWDEYDEYEQPPSYKELEILIKGIDAFEYGEDSLSFIRPDADAIENGFDNSWDFEEICKGYAEFADGYNESNVICRLDDMMIFDSDSDAAIQAKKDGYQFLEVGKDIIFPEEMLNDDIEYRNYIDTPENRTILKDFLRLKEHSISVDYAFPDDLTYKKEDGNEIKITIYEEPRWDFEDNNELLNIIKEADEDYYDEIKKIITENPSRKFDFDLGKSLRYDDNTFYNSFHIDYSKETLSQKLDNKFIVRYWTTDDTFENKLPQISNFDFAGEDSTIIILNNEVTEKLNAMIRKHVKNNIDAFENYKTYRNEQISKVLYAEIKQHGEPIITINEDGETNARFQTFTISNDLHDLLELPHVSWHDAQTGKSYPYQYALYADFNLDGNSIDETKEPEIKYFEFIDDGTKEIQSADSMKRNLGLLEQNQSIKEVITNTFKQVAQEYYNQNVSFELPVEQQNETTMQFTTENTKKTQMYKIIYKQSSQGIKEWHEYDPNGNEIHYKDSNGVEEWREYDSNGNKIHYKNSDGYEEWNEYNDNGNKIHYKDSEGFEVWYEYDSNGNKICSKDSDNLETQHENDSNGNEIYSKRSDDYEQWYEYDSNGNKIHYKDSNGFEQWYEYNSNGKEIHYKDSHSFEYWKEYDSKGNVIHYKDATGFERWLKYDSNGNHIYSKDSNGSEKWSTVEYLTKEQYLLEKNEPVQKLNKAESLTFGQFNSETNEIKLIKEAYFKELVIDENDASKNKVVLGFKENDQEQLLEMGEVEYKNLLNAFGFSKEQQENTLEINKYKTFAEEKPEVVFELIKSDYLGGTPFSDNELIGYLKGLKKSNNYHHYLDELLFESLEQSDESLFSNVVDVGADLTWRREENGEPINILHYAAADNLDIAIRKIIEKTKSLEVDDYINLFSEENFEGHTPLEIAISNSGGEYFESTKLLIDAMDDKGFSGVKDLLFEDKLGNKVLYTSKDNLDCVSILCFDKNNNIISSDTESLVDEKSLGEIISQDLIYQTNNDFIKGNIELNRSSKLISELKEVPQKLWNDEINIKLLKTLPEAGFFNSKKDLYDFDSILALEKIKKSLFSDFDNQKESLLQGLYTKKEFVDSIKEKELNLEELNNCEIGEFVECLENKYFRTELAALCFDKKINELFDTISPRPNEMGMYKNNDYTCLRLKISAASNNRPITEGEAEIILKYIQYENFNFYESMNNELCMLDVSEDFTGEGKIMTPEKIVDMAHRMMVKARDEEYSIYDVKDEEVFNDLRNKFGLIEEQQIGSSKDEELKNQATSVIKQFFSKLKDSLYDNAKLEDVLKSAATVLQTFSDTEKKEISQYLNDKGASSGDRVGKVLSSILEIKEPGQKKKRSKADDDTRGR